jgi:uncharacterized protein YndB with AHSA1/START domain
MELEASTVIDRPVATVWDWYAVHHVENHPRWDTAIELENPTGGPLGVGTVVKRRSTRVEPPTEGTMEIVEFEPEKIMRANIQDGPMKIDGWARFAAAGENQTKLTIGGDFPGTDDWITEMMRQGIEESAATIKSLIESET